VRRVPRVPTGRHADHGSRRVRRKYGSCSSCPVKTAQTVLSATPVARRDAYVGHRGAAGPGDAYVGSAGVGGTLTLVSIGVLLATLVNAFLGLGHTDEFVSLSSCVGVLLATLVNAFLGLGHTNEFVSLSSCVGVLPNETVPRYGEVSLSAVRSYSLRALMITCAGDPRGAGRTRVPRGSSPSPRCGGVSSGS